MHRVLAAEDYGLFLKVRPNGAKTHPPAESCSWSLFPKSNEASPPSHLFPFVRGRPLPQAMLSLYALGWLGSLCHLVTLTFAGTLGSGPYSFLASRVTTHLPFSRPIHAATLLLLTGPGIYDRFHVEVRAPFSETTSSRFWRVARRGLSPIASQTFAPLPLPPSSLAAKIHHALDPLAGKAKQAIREARSKVCGFRVEA